MSYAPQEIQKTVYSTLNGSNDLSTKIGVGKVFDGVPDGQSYPFVTIDLQSNEDRGSQTTDGWTHRVVIHAFQRGTNIGKKFIQETQAIIEDLLHNKPLQFEAFTNLSLRRVNSLVFVEEDNISYHGVQTFEILTGEP